MHPDVFITIVFAGIAVLFAVVFAVGVVPRIRQEGARVAERESGAPRTEQTSAAPSRSHRREGAA